MSPIERQFVRRDVRAWIKRALKDWAASTDQREAILRALGIEGYPLHVHARLRAGALSAIAYRIAGEHDPSGPVQAAAIAELFMASGYMLDDVMDEDLIEGASIGQHTALGLSTLLIAQAALDRAADALAPRDRSRLLTESRRLVLSSCDAQWHELAASKDATAASKMTTDQAMALTQAKAGSLGELCCVIGLGLAGALTSPVAGHLRECYFHHFTYLQIIDDLADAVESSKSKQGDIEAGRPTLPTVFFHKAQAKLGASTNAETPPPDSRMEALGNKTSPTNDDLQATGTVLFTQLAAETRRNRAIELARLVDREFGGAEDLLSSIGATQSEGGGSTDSINPAKVGASL